MASQPRTTTEILALRTLGVSVDHQFVDWAVAQLESGSDTPHLRILAGEMPPFNQFEMVALVDKVLGELSLEPPRDKESALRSYAKENARAVRAGTAPAPVVLADLSQLCIEFDYPSWLYDFYLLHHARSRLEVDEVQFYWPEADRDNIDAVIDSYFQTWLADNTDG